MLEINNISKKLGDFSLNNVSFTVSKGEYFVILGQSGAGKSVILEVLSGLITIDSGEIKLNNKSITNEKIQHRNIGLVFQDYAVFPHKSVYENISYPLKIKKLPKKDIDKKVRKLAKRMNITHLLDRGTTNLSGGELQRVALARTLALEPEVLLLDEPLSSLDTILREDLRGLLRKLNKLGQTIIHVTHEYEEAISLADKVGIIHNGTIVQQGIPRDVFMNPKSEFVASLAGIKNFFKTKIIKQNTALVSNNVEISLLSNSIESEGCLLIAGNDIFLSIEKKETSAMNNFQGTIIDLYPSKSGYEVIVDIGIKIVSFVTESAIEKFNLAQGNQIWISFKASAVRFLKI